MTAENHAPRREPNPLARWVLRAGWVVPRNAATVQWMHADLRRPGGGWRYGIAKPATYALGLVGVAIATLAAGSDAAAVMLIAGAGALCLIGAFATRVRAQALADGTRRCSQAIAQLDGD